MGTCGGLRRTRRDYPSWNVSQQGPRGLPRRGRRWDREAGSGPASLLPRFRPLSGSSRMQVRPTIGKGNDDG